MILRWAVLLEFVYVYSFPVIFMLTASIKTVAEFNHPTIQWISRDPSLAGYRWAWEILGYATALRNSLLVSVLAALGQTISGAVIAYSFARLRFPGRDILFGFLMFTIIVPLQSVMVPQFMLYGKLKWMNTYLPMIVPAFFGQGVRGGILLVVYRQFFRGLPYELQDAAYVDGAGPLRTFWRIMLPLAKPAILVVALFSLVWTWNDHFLPLMVLRDRKLLTLPLRMENFRWLLPNLVFGNAPLPESVFPAAVVLTVAPLLVLYIFTQRYFTQSVDRTGLVE